MQAPRVTVEYARGLAAGEIPQTTIPRTPTCDAAYKIHCDAVKSSGMSLGEYIKHNVLRGEDTKLELSPFPYVCDLGITHYIYWMRDGYEPVEDVRRKIATVLEVDESRVYVVRNTTQSVPEVPHYQVFVHVDEPDILAPCYELPGNPRTNADHEADWSAVLGHPVHLEYFCGGYLWQTTDSIKKIGGSVRTFHVMKD